MFKARNLRIYLALLSIAFMAIFYMTKKGVISSEAAQWLSIVLLAITGVRSYFEIKLRKQLSSNQFEIQGNVLICRVYGPNAIIRIPKNINISEIVEIKYDKLNLSTKDIKQNFKKYLTLSFSVVFVMKDGQEIFIKVAGMREDLFKPILVEVIRKNPQIKCSQEIFEFIKGDRKSLAQLDDQNSMKVSKKFLIVIGVLVGVAALLLIVGISWLEMW